MQNRGKLLVISLLALMIISGISCRSPASPAFAQSRPSNLHDYSITVMFSDLAVPTPTFKIKILSNADKVTLNSTILEKRMHFDIVGPAMNNSKTAPDGYFEVIIPHALLGGDYTILVNNATTTQYNTTYNQGGLEGAQSGDSTTITINYDGLVTKTIDILGTTAIPEFPLFSDSTFLASVVPASTAAIMIVALLSVSRFRISQAG